MYSQKDSIETKVIWSNKSARIVAKKSYNHVSLFFETSFQDALGYESWQPATECDIVAFLFLEITEKSLNDYGIKKISNGRTNYRYYPIGKEGTKDH
jgi:hypothetical protein